MSFFIFYLSNIGVYVKQAQELEEAKEEEYEMKHMSKEGGRPPTKRAPAKKAAATTTAHAGGKICYYQLKRYKSLLVLLLSSLS